MTRDELRRSPRYYMCMHGACSCSPQLYTVEKAAYHVFDISTIIRMSSSCEDLLVLLCNA